VEVVASLFQGRTAAAQCGLFTHKSVPVIFEPPCIYILLTLKNNGNVSLENQKTPTSRCSFGFVKFRK